MSGILSLPSLPISCSKCPRFVLKLCALALTIGTLGVGADALSADCPPKRALRLSPPELPVNIDKVKAQLREYQFLNYRLDITDVLSDAQAYVEKRATQVPRPALVLDIDETSVLNWPVIDADDFGFINDGACDFLPKGPCGFAAWVRKGSAEAIFPTLRLYRVARANGVAVFFVTGRHEIDRAVTNSTLRAARYGDQAKGNLIMRPDDDGIRSVQTFKTEARRSIEASGHSIIANVGDQESDLAGESSECIFKVPNPFYFIP